MISELVESEQVDTETWKRLKSHMQYLRTQGIEKYNCQGCLDTGIVLIGENMAVRPCSSGIHKKE